VYSFRANYSNDSGDFCNSIAPAPSVFRQADVIVLALHANSLFCVANIERQIARLSRAPLVFFGSKNFGYNINPFGRVPMALRDSALSAGPVVEMRNNAILAQKIGSSNYVDLLAAFGPDGKHVRFYDDEGNPLSPDRLHLTYYGARFAAARLRNHPALRLIETAKSES
jgi:hypothetical protein